MVTDPTYWLVLLAALLAFWTVPDRWRLGVLAAISFAFLASLEPVGTPVLLVWSLLFFALAPREQPRWIGAALVLLVLGYLAWFKYVPGLLGLVTVGSPAGRLIIPLGISYFTFKLIHYAVEVRRGRMPPHSAASFLCYIFLLPIFSAGPIERFDHFLEQREERWRLASAVEGATRIVHGLVKKFALGATVELRLQEIATLPALLAGLPEFPVHEVWAWCALQFLFVYLDFSAYTDIAIGTSRLFGLRIMENFHWPILAPNIADFWRRWHMTLAGWCQSYVYLPTIGLTRNPYLAVVATFLAIGLWHAGALHYVAWGLYHAAGVVFYQSWRRLRRRRGFPPPTRGWRAWLGVPVTFLFVSGSFAFTATYPRRPVWDAIRILARLFSVDLPPL